MSNKQDGTGFDMSLLTPQTMELMLQMMHLETPPQEVDENTGQRNGVMVEEENPGRPASQNTTLTPPSQVEPAQRITQASTPMNTPTSNSAAALPGAPIVSTQPSAPTPAQPANNATVQPTPVIERVATPPPPYPSLEARQIRVPPTVTPLPTAGQPGSSQNPPSITTTGTTGGQNRNSEQARPPQPGAPSQRPNGARVSAARANVVRVQRPQAPSLRLLYDQLAEVAAPFHSTLSILPSLPARIRTFFSQLLQFLRYQLPFKGIYETETMAYWIILLSVASYYFGMGRTGKFVKHAAIVAVAAESLRRLSGNGRW